MKRNKEGGPTVLYHHRLDIYGKGVLGHLWERCPRTFRGELSSDIMGQGRGDVGIIRESVFGLAGERCRQNFRGKVPSDL